MKEIPTWQQSHFKRLVRKLMKEKGYSEPLATEEALAMVRKSIPRATKRAKGWVPSITTQEERDAWWAQQIDTGLVIPGGDDDEPPVGDPEGGGP